MPLKNGKLFINAVTISDTPAEAGDPITVEVEVRNGALHIPTQDSDRCSNDANPCQSGGIGSSEGFCVEVSIDVNGSPVDTKTDCIRVALIGAAKKVFQFSTTVPDVDQGLVDATLTAAGTGEAETVRESFEIVQPPPDNGNGDNGNGGGGSCDSDGDCPEGFVCRNGTCVRAVAGIPRNHLIIAGSGAAIGLGLFIASRDND